MRNLLRHATHGPWGDSKRHQSRADLEAQWVELPPPPKDLGRVDFLVSRVGGSRRETPTRVQLTCAAGMPDDAWARESSEKVDAQLAVMRADVARMIANGQALTLFGDNLFVDLDLSTANLPPGSRLRVGEALVEVTPEPHDGCRKFNQRFGKEALRLTADARFRPLHLRGIYWKVIEDGEVGVGDSISVVSRPAG